MSLIKKICSILFVAYDICGCCDCNCLLYQAYKSAPWWSHNNPFYVSKELMPIFNESKDEIQLQKGDRKKIHEYILSSATTVNSPDTPKGLEVSKWETNKNLFSGYNLADSNGEWRLCGQLFRNVYLLSISKIPCVFIKGHIRCREKTNAQRPLLVFYHGNGDNIFELLDGSVYDEFPLLNALSYYYDILIPELPGYNINQPGDFSETTRNKQINAIYQWCQEYYADKLVVMGHSLGCHFAILLAAKAQNNCKHLVLCNPFMT
ncbi:MAG: alpha/beta fold hydrolase, partial [Cytophagales bacterium]|nr:alpha/beta fold hydrolase [Cytophagales bacterium]